MKEQRQEQPWRWVARPLVLEHVEQGRVRERPYVVEQGQQTWDRRYEYIVVGVSNCFCLGGGMTGMMKVPRNQMINV